MRLSAGDHLNFQVGPVLLQKLCSQSQYLLPCCWNLLVCLCALYLRSENLEAVTRRLEISHISPENRDLVHCDSRS